MPRRRSILTALVACALLAGCGTQTTPTPPAPTSTGSPAPSAAIPTAGPTVTATVAPAPSSTPVASAGPLPSASVATGASACSGSLDNRTFFEEIAAQVSWDVYCAVLPSGWHVRSGPDGGSFSLRDSGRLEITYTNSQGAVFALKEGNYCTQSAGACAPQEQALGSTAFGDRTGQLAAVGGGYAVYVDPGSNPSWQATGSGLDQGAFVTLAAALYKVGHGS